MSSPTKTNASMGNTMYNLTNKRTLPREVIKWMQGLDLSYSVKDYRKDMTNGFLIAEIISRYEPGRIPMHAFENSQNVARRDNNWNQLNLFFKKHTIRDVQIGAEQFTAVMKSNDPRSEQLYQLICRLYSVCTKRTLSENAPIVDLPPTQTNNPNLTASYLLKEEGLEKLDNSNLAGSGIKSKVLEPGKSDEKDKSQDRVPTRKIVSSLDGNSNMVDVMGIGIKADNRKATSKRKSWEAKEESNYSQDNADSEKLIFDYLSEMIEECLPPSDTALRQQLISQNSKFSPTEALRKALPSIDREFFCNFLNQVVLNITELVPIFLRELNETWKFFTYFLKMVRHYPFESQEFTLLHQIIQSYAIAGHNRQIKRIQKVFIDSLLVTIIGEARVCREWKKKEKLMALVYDFQGREMSDKKVVLSKLKEYLGSNSSLYMEWLSILVRQEIEPRNNLGNKLIEDYIYYAHQYLGSSVNLLRTAALKIFYEVSKTQCHELLQTFFQARAIAFQNSSCDPQQVLLLVLIYCNLLREVIASKEYQTLVKGNNASSLVKVYNPDNEKNLDDLRKKTQLLGETVHHLFNCTSDITVRQICARMSVPLLPESQPLMQVFLQFISGVEEKEEFMKASQSEYELKSFKLTCGSVEISIIEQYSNQILVQVIGLMLRQGVGVEKYLFLINHSLKHLNVKKVNMQIWEDIALHIAKPYTELLTNEHYCRQVFQGIKNICLIHFNFDMKIRELPGWLAKSIVEISAAAKSSGLNEVKLFNEFLNTEYARGRHDSIRFMMEQLAQQLQSKGAHNLIAIQEVS